MKNKNMNKPVEKEKAEVYWEEKKKKERFLKY